MNKIAIITLACSIFVALTPGCKTPRYAGAPPPSYDVDTDLKQLAAQFKPTVAISNFYALGTNATAADRNRVISGRLVMINLEYLKWVRTMTADKQLLDSASDILVLSLSLASTAAGGATAKTVLSAMAAGIAGSKTAVDKYYYYEKTLPALVAAMNAERKSALTNILVGMSKPLTEYTFEQGLANLQEYYQAGTLLGAVVSVQSDAAAKEKVADEAVKAAQVKLSTVRSAEFVTERAQKRVDAILGAIDGLSDSAAVDLEKNPPVRDPETDSLINLRDPAKKRETDGKIAKQALKIRAVLAGKRSEQELSAWEAAVKAAK